MMLSGPPGLRGEGVADVQWGVSGGGVMRWGVSGGGGMRWGVSGGKRVTGGVQDQIEKRLEFIQQANLFFYTLE